MTVTIESKTIEKGSEKVLIEISQNKYEQAYKVVQAYAIGSSDFRTEKETYYNDLKKAKARYNYLIKQASKY